MGKKKRITEHSGLRVIVKTPVELSPASRGFYQVEEDVLYVPVFPSGQFYSYLDSSRVLLDIDRSGRLVFIQILAPRRSWRVRKSLRPPGGAGDADIRFRDFRGRLPRASILTDTDRSLVNIRFSSVRNPTRYRVADQLVFDLTARATLAGIWILDIEDDRAARGMASWRKTVSRQFDKQTYDSQFSRNEMKP